MDGRQFDQVSKKLSAWLTRRKLFTGLTAGAVGSILVRGSGSSKSQGDSYQETPADPPVDAPVEEESVSTDEFPTDTPTPTPTDTPTPTPTDTPTPTPTDESPPAEEQGQEQGQGQGEGQEPPPDQTGSRAAPDESRRRIVELCAEAADVLDGDLEKPGDFENHPHPAQAVAFLDRLQVMANWGLEAETWDDAMLANYVNAFDTVALAVRIGADAYYEVQATEAQGDQALGFQPIKREGEESGDPDTCIFNEIDKWTVCIEDCQKNDDTPLCRVTCFWNFTVLQSCRRCLRAF